MIKVNFMVGSTNFNKKGQAPIRISLAVNGFRHVTTIGYSLSPQNWNKNKQEVKAKYQYANSINRYLSGIKAYFLNIVNTRSIASKADLAKLFDIEYGIVKKKKQLSLESCAFIDKAFMAYEREGEKKYEWSQDYVNKVDVVRRYLKRFNPTLKMDDLTEDCLTNFQYYLKTVPEVHCSNLLKQHNHARSNGLAIETVYKRLQFLKSFMIWAEKRGYCKNVDYKSFKPEHQGLDKRSNYIALTKTECDILEQAVFPPDKQYLEKARDVLMFTCYSGLRYSDAKRLRWLDIKEEYLEITELKTGNSYHLYLNSHLVNIIKKYRAKSHKETDFVFPILSNQVMNRHYKELGAFCNISSTQRVVFSKDGQRDDFDVKRYELMTTHTGRRTFASLLVAAGAGISEVQKALNHKKISTTEKYIVVSDESKAKTMSLLNGM